MKTKLLAVCAAVAMSVCVPAQAQAPIEIQWWHSMSAALGDWVNDLAKQYNASQTKYKVVPTCRIPDDCIDSKRYPLFMARAVLQELIESLQYTRGVKSC